MKPFDMRFGYQAWRYFLENLIDGRSRDLFQSYMTAYMRHPGDYRSLFEHFYGTPLPEAIREFQRSIRAGR